jgi:hypothetical protein
MTDDRAEPRTLPRVRCADCAHHRSRHGRSRCGVAHMDVRGADQERQCMYYEGRRK